MAGRDLAYGDSAGDAQSHIKKIKISSNDRPLDFFSSASSNSFLGSGAMVSFGAVGSLNGSGNSYCHSFDPQENGGEYLDDYFHQPEKKKRLSVDQVQFLERSFEADNKLEPERKIQLANKLGLQPRQIAVWFQNRRARWKTKQIETEYETLHASYDSLRTDYDCLLEENEKLKAEVSRIKHCGLAQDIENVNLQLCDTKEQSEPIPKDALAYMISAGEVFEGSAKASKTDDKMNVSRKEEDSSDEEECIFHKMEDAYCPRAISCGYEFAAEDHVFNFWSY